MTEPEKRSLGYAKPLALTAIALAIIVAIVYVSFFADLKSLEAFFFVLLEAFGLPGLFIAAILANATIVFPLPLDFLVFPLGEMNFYGLGILSPLAVGIAVGFGAAIGELTGYFLGRVGAKGIEKLTRREMKKVLSLKEKVQTYGMIFIFLFALFPSAFDFVGIAAGLIKFDARKFFIACAAGKTLRYILIGYFGRVVIGFLYGAHFL
ncbi:MAG: VTT domain-containing protein [Candidatus Diapherotrites archaeon]|nr:VTT domain-containing protein [Candidatus Diapherotrites archaeon]